MSDRNGWQRAKINDFCEVTSSKRTYAKDIVERGVPFYRSKEVIELFNGQREFSNPLFITQERYEGIKEKFGVPQIGDVMITSRGTLGIPLVIKDSRPFYFADGNLSWFKNLEGIDPFMLYYWLLSPSGKAQLQKCTIGSSQQAYTIVQLKEMEIQLPPLPTQRKIASILSAYDDLIENNTRRIAILEEMAQAIYREWFVNFRFPGHENVKLVDSPLGQIPEGWEVVAFSDIADFVNGFAFKPKHQETSGKAIIKIAELKNGITAKTPFNSGEAIPEKYHITNGDVLFSWSADLDVYIWMLGDGLLNQHLFTVLPKSYSSKLFLYFSLKDRMSEFRQRSLGTTMRHIKRSALSEVKCCTPDDATRLAFEEVVSPLIDLKQTLVTKQINLRSIRDLLLPKLISGKLEVEDLDIDVGMTAEALEEATA